MVVAAPHEVLLIIFDAVAYPEPFSWPDASYNRNCAEAPFILSSVCRNWRSIVRGTPDLWTYFGFPSDPKKDALNAHLNRLRELQTLSKDKLIDVVFRCKLDRYREYDSLEMYTAHHDYRVQIVDVLNNTAPRWRNAALRLPHILASRMDITISDHFPALEALSIWFDQVYMTSLPRAPRLQRLYLECSGLRMVADATAICVPSLTSLATATASSSVYFTFFAAKCDTLRELCILEELSRTSSSAWIFPCLTSLTLEDASFMNVIQAPNLHSLAVNCGRLQSVNGVALSRFAKVVQDLTIYSGIPPDLVNLLAEFSSVKSLSVGKPEIVKWGLNGAVHDIPAGMFAKLAELAPPVWPKLERMHLNCVGFGDEDVSNEEGILAIVRARLPTDLPVRGVDQPVSLRRVDIGPNLPRSLYARLQTLIGDSGILNQPAHM
ncbi:hypothetical protein BKA62DRAFT_705589 [Auriculariales sp. MPI-PUGE-AT-0066]|nr:hypothetical protein BKA62DRAFT_705589 [Auriculariales sp. MPI-PUGE-AT-0066]